MNWLRRLISNHKPFLVICDCHPKLADMAPPHLLYERQKGKAQWDWEVGASQLGPSQCGVRGIIVFAMGKVSSSDQIAPIRILYVVIPGNLIDLLEPPTQDAAVIKGELVINTGTNRDISQHTPTGRINLPLDHLAPGVKVKTATSSGILHSAVSTNRSNVCADGAVRRVENKSFQRFPTRSLGYSEAGLRFLIGESTLPSGRAHAIIYDSDRSIARSLSQLEFWALHGGRSDGRAIWNVEEMNSRLTTTPPPSLEMYLGVCVWGGSLFVDYE